MSTKTNQKLTSSREGLVQRKRKTSIEGSPKYTAEIRSIIPDQNEPILQQQQQQQSSSSPLIQRRRQVTSLQQRYGHWYPYIATLIVTMILYGLYTSTFQPAPIGPIEGPHPPAQGYYLQIRSKLNEYYNLWKLRFSDMKEPIEGSVVYRQEHGGQNPPPPTHRKEGIQHGPSEKPVGERVHSPLQEPMVEQNPVRDYTNSKEHSTIFNIEQQFKPEHQENNGHFHGIMEEIRDKFFNQRHESINKIQNEVDAILKEAENSRMSFYHDWKDKKEFTFDDLQQLRYKLRDGYRDTREFIYRKSKDGEKILNHLKA
ncbi:hypothetical protein DLAC_06545 [Tieghemostelium lacteum]|uniref:Transmembrane protein n=1 Tax=Tieghemostelium lacteum TaxID=361077 RepID=A0A151ZFB0_TIELA|nr:hypothetical protein DLAC_06545 [Tieghemostelium lacteum]|eukprot:KYQ92554.1 hypothetical protein DLAC_06545 [Tieghemostelium lacteum]